MCESESMGIYGRKCVCTLSLDEKDVKMEKSVFKIRHHVTYDEDDHVLMISKCLKISTKRSATVQL